MAVNINVPSQVKTYANLAAFPASGALKTIYIAEDTNKTYRWTGSVYVEVSAAGASGITIGTTAITSGTVGRVLFEGTGNVVQESANLFWDNTNGRLGIGTSSPAFRLEVQGGDVRFANGLTIGTAGSAGWQFSSNTVTLIQNGFLGVDVAGGREFNFTNTSFSTTYLKLASFTGNVLINTTTDAGYKLDVNGTARVQDRMDVAGTNGRLIFKSPELSTRLNGIHWTNPTDTVSYGYIALSGGTGEMRMFTGLTYFPTFYSSGSEAMRIATTGNLLINTTTDSGYKLDVVGTIRATYITTPLIWSAGSDPLALATQSGTSAVTIFPTTRNVVIQNGGIHVDAGYKLDVNGTARVSGDITGTSYITCGIGFAYNFGSTATQIKHYNGNSLGFLLGNAWYGRITTGGTVFGSDTINASAVLEAVSTTKGFLPPRLTTTQKNAIATPAAGLMVYDTTLTRPCFYDGTTWITL